MEMRVFQPIDIKDTDEGPFQFGGDNWTLITASKAPEPGETAPKVNTMTASWGGITYIWEKRCAVIYVRESRYTREFLDEAGRFSLCFFDHAKFRGTMKYLGTVSGRHEDKIAGARLTVDFDGGIPYFYEAKDVLLCRTLYRQDFKPDCFVDRSIRDQFYEKGDEHTMYIAEIRKVMIR